MFLSDEARVEARGEARGEAMHACKCSDPPFNGTGSAPFGPVLEPAGTLRWRRLVPLLEPAETLPGAGPGAGSDPS